ncbi:MAG: DUF4331 domain-containing protein [Ktedonobacteraceae bacterium]|nr:DUF4331 domain-containing protein [Ktedonobacteraceae bacterium]MBO0792208.1 DUF4331 domain-containing protein [Ktedonobacteraceae bacterium]
MSSHREAPEISKDPVADNTDVYAFVSPDKPDTVTLITNYIPLEEPAGGPNFYEFGDDVLYEIHIDNNGDALPDITYQFLFTTRVRNPNSFLYNSGPITSLDSPNWNRRQFYSVTKVVRDGKTTVLGKDLSSPPCNIGPRSTLNYAALAQAAVHRLSTGETVFAGQRDEGFYVDLGAVFDLLDLRPFQQLHLIPTANVPGIDGTKGFNVHTIAIQVPKTHLTRDGSQPTNVTDSRSVIGVWGTASRRKATIRGVDKMAHKDAGPWVQVSRLANPLFNEVIVPLGKKDLWNSLSPKDDEQFVQFVQNPEVARLLPVLYPGVFPNLAALKAPRADLVAILLTGIPAGLIPGFQNFTGKRFADMLRLNMAIPPSAKPHNLGLLGGDLAGFPNGRRVFDDSVTIELRAVAGVTYPLIDKNFKPDAAASQVTDGAPPNDKDAPYLGTFPYLGVPNAGFDSASRK